MNTKLFVISIFLATVAAEVRSQSPSVNVAEARELVGSDALAEHIKNAKQYKVTHGTPPDINFYYSVISKLTRNDSALLYSFIESDQHPKISRDDLLSIFEAMRDSIRSFWCEYKDSSQPAGTSCFAFKETKMYLKEPLLDAKGKVVSSVTSFDGDLFRRVVGRAEQGMAPAATVQKDETLSIFYRPDMPLCQARLFDMNRTGSSAPSLSDFTTYVKLACVVYEGPKVFDGAKYLLVSDGAADFYLDESKNFSVARCDNFENDWKDDGDGGKMISGRRLVQSNEFSKFVDYGNAIWLPNEIQVTTFRSGQPSDAPKELSRRVISVVNMRVNPELDDSLFSDVVPKTAFVMDETNGLAYREGMRDSINGMVRDTVTPKSGYSFYVWLNVIAIVVFVIVVLVRQMRAEKK